MMTIFLRSILTPDEQFYFTLIVFLAVLIAIGGAIFWGHWKIQQLRIQLKPVGTFRNTLREMSAILRHDGPEFPEPEFKEIDALLDAANAEPEVPMSKEDDVRLDELIEERAKSTHPALRGEETTVASAYSAMKQLARSEDKNPGALSGVTTVGTQAPSEMSATDKTARNEN